MEQRTPAWYEIRRGKVTGSEVGKFVFNTDAKALTARRNLINAKIGEEADGDDCPPNYEDYNMKRGSRLESRALAAFEIHTGMETETVGFVEHDTLPLGVSPDALLSQRTFGLEMKCPIGKIQIARLEDNVCPEDYLPQIWLSMIVTGLPCWHFWSWHPVIPAFHIVVRREEIPAAFEPGVYALLDALAAKKAWLASL